MVVFGSVQFSKSVYIYMSILWFILFVISAGCSYMCKLLTKTLKQLVQIYLFIFVFFFFFLLLCALIILAAYSFTPYYSSILAKHNKFIGLYCYVCTLLTVTLFQCYYEHSATLHSFYNHTI